MSNFRGSFHKVQNRDNQFVNKDVVQEENNAFHISWGEKLYENERRIVEIELEVDSNMKRWTGIMGYKILYGYSNIPTQRNISTILNVGTLRGRKPVSLLFRKTLRAKAIEPNLDN